MEIWVWFKHNIFLLAFCYPMESYLRESISLSLSSLISTQKGLNWWVPRFLIVLHSRIVLFYCLSSPPSLSISLPLSTFLPSTMKHVVKMASLIKIIPNKDINSHIWLFKFTCKFNKEKTLLWTPRNTSRILVIILSLSPKQFMDKNMAPNFKHLCNCTKDGLPLLILMRGHKFKLWASPKRSKWY